MDNFIEMTEDEWFETYKPIKNHIDVNASFDGHMFETYGDEVEFVKSTPPNHIWMYGDGDDGGSYLWSNCDAEFEDPDNLIRDKFDSIDLEKCPNCATIEEMKKLEETE